MRFALGVGCGAADGCAVLLDVHVPIDPELGAGEDGRGGIFWHGECPYQPPQFGGELAEAVKCSHFR